MDATPFGQYQLQELIGRGGMGEVYMAFDTNTDRVVALKVLPSHLAEDAIFQQRFPARIAGRGGHQRTSRGADPWLRRDRRTALPGHAADRGPQPRHHARRRRDKPLKPALAVSMIEQVAAALDAAHEAGLIHRDVKPSNILVTENDFAYLIDFGLARTAGQQGLTTAGSTLGTMAYMSPERFEGGDIDPRSDVYALTCVLYECLTGSRPYPVDSLEQQIARHINAPAPKPSAIDPKLAAFDEVIAKGMAKKPGRRYQTAGEMAAAARQALSVPVRTTGGSGRHSAGRAKQNGAPRTVWRGRWRSLGAAVCWCGAGVRCVAVVGRAGATADRRDRPSTSSTPEPVGRIGRRGAGDRGDAARRHQGLGPADDRRQCSLRAQTNSRTPRVTSSASTST